MSDRPSLPAEFQRDSSLTRSQASGYLGISEPFLKKLDLSRQGPVAYRIGRRWTYLKSDLDAWREAHRYDPAQGHAGSLDQELGLRPAARLQPSVLSEAADPSNKKTQKPSADRHPATRRASGI